MLKRLIKYEFRATARTFLPMYAALLLLSVLAGLFYTIDFKSERPVVIMTLLGVMVFTAVWVIVFAAILRRFWNNILGREGYLMNVLPVEPWQHVFAKMLVSTVWFLLGALVSAAALMIIVCSLSSIARPALEEIIEFLQSCLTGLWENGILTHTILAGVQLLLGVVVSCFFSLLSVYFAMTVGQLANNHRVWASLGAYFGLSIVLSLLTTNFGGKGLELFLFGRGDFWHPDWQDLPGIMNAGNFVLLCNNLITLILSVVLLFATARLLKKHLNLQ